MPNKRLEKKKQVGLGLIFVALGASLWGTDAVLRVPLIQTLSSWQIVFLEHLVLVVFALPIFIRYFSSYRKLKTKEWLLLLTISFGSSALATWLFTEGFRYGDPNAVILLQKFQPLFALVVAQFLLREKLPSFFGPMVLVALLGAYLLSFGWSAPFGGLSVGKWVGSLFAIGAAGLWGAGTVFGRKLLTKLTFTELTAGRFLFALPLLAVMQAVTPHQSSVFALQRVGWLYVVLLALVPGLLGLLIYYFGLKETKASYATLAELSFPATSLLLNGIILGQTMNGIQWVGFLIVWLTVVILSSDFFSKRLVKISIDPNNNKSSTWS